MILLRPILLDQLAQRAERGEGRDSLWIIGPYLIPIGLGDRQGQFERVNRVQAKTFTEKRLLWLNLHRIDLQIERLYNKFCNIRLQW